MAQYIKKDALVAEINALLDDEFQCNSYDEATGFQNALTLIEKFIDTLEVKEVREEPVSNNLEEAARNYPSAIRVASPQWESELENAFKAGAEWQKKQTIEKACEWLRINYEDIGIRYIRGHKVEDEIESFKKAMEE